MTVAAFPDTRLDAFVRRVADRLKPNRIILFGSRARGDGNEESDYDIVVEVAGDPRAVASAVSRATRDVSIYSDIIVRAPGDIERRMHDVGLLDYDIVREGIVLYSADAGFTRQHLRPVLRLREGIGEPPESVALWLERADEDVLNIEAVTAADVVPWSTVCFHAQQAAEKYLKVLLIQKNIRPPRTHELKELLPIVRKAGYAVPGIDDDCVFLSQFAIGARDPDQVPMPRAAEGRRAADAARRIVALVNPLVIRPSSPPVSG
jgi:HEPN domain-containing protein/predicted nucleotidyltransferase